jgi:organic radical activating enzyme
MEHWDFRHHLIQPLDDPNRDDHRAKAIAFVMANPQWRLTTQVHKTLNLP